MFTIKLRAIPSGDDVSIFHPLRSSALNAWGGAVGSKGSHAIDLVRENTAACVSRQARIAPYNPPGAGLDVLTPSLGETRSSVRELDRSILKSGMRRVIDGSYRLHRYRKRCK